MKRLLLSIILFISCTCTSAFALNKWNYLDCSGYDTTGKPIHLSAYSDSNYVTINGDMLKIVGVTRNGQGVVTENFIATSGVLVYDSIVPAAKNIINLYQFNAVTEKLLAQASLICSLSGNHNTSHIIDQKMFTPIKGAFNATNNLVNKQCLVDFKAGCEQGYRLRKM